MDEIASRIGTLGVEVAELLAAPSRAGQRDSRLSVVLRSATPATRRRVLRVAEALLREEVVETRPKNGQRRRSTAQ